MSNQNGGPTRTVPTELDVLAAARRDAFERSEAAWTAYQAALWQPIEAGVTCHRYREEATALRHYWEACEAEWIRAQKAWLTAYDAWAAEKGYTGDAPAHGAPTGDAP